MSSQIIDRLRVARDRGTAFILSQQQEDGAYNDPASNGIGPLYKTLWALVATGESEAASRLATWTADNLLTPGGDFAGPMRGHEFDHNYIYGNAWFVIGAQKLGRYDISRPGIEFIRSMQQANGGLSMDLGNPNSQQDVLNTAQGGQAFLACGDLESALRVADWLRVVHESQPDFEHELFFVVQPQTGLITQIPEGEKQRNYSIRVDIPKARYFNIGIGPAFLSRLTMLTGDMQYAELGRKYIDFAFRTLDEMYETAQVGKVGWGSALLFAVTGEPAMYELASRVGEALIAQQTDTGGWDNTAGYLGDAVRTQITAEFVTIIDEMIAGMSSRP